MFTKACQRCAPWGKTLIRVVLGLIMLMHGWPKLFGDTAELLSFFQSTILPAPDILLPVAGVLEVVGGILLIIGLATRFVSFILAVQFIVIILFVKLKMGWFAYELDLLILASLVSLFDCKGQDVSVDRLISKFWSKKHNPHGKGGHGAEAITGREGEKK